MQSIKIKEWHLHPIHATIRKSDWTAYDLTSFDEVRLIVANPDGTTKINSPAVFVDKPAWRVRYDFSSPDVSVPWTFMAYFSFRTSGVKLEASPVDYFQIVITNDFL